MTHSSQWKISKSRLDAIRDLDIVIRKINIGYLLIGAMARDLLDQLSNIKSIRFTEDLDFAISIPTWDDFEKLANLLSETKKFRRSPDKRCRFIHISTKIPVDIIPFGKIDHPDYSISWPPDKDFGMSTIGFREAYDESTEVLLSEDPLIKIRVPSRAGLAILKLIAWGENPARRKDALDILHLIRYYLDSNNEKRLYEQDSDIMDDDNFDYECAGAMLLGRDIASIASSRTIKAIDDIIRVQISEDSDFRLISDMIVNSIDREYEFDQLLRLLKCMRDGIKDIKNDVS